MSTRFGFVAMALALLVAGVAANAAAQQRRPGPCAEDAKKFCGGVPPGQGAIARCMREHQAELSPACQAALAARAQKAARARDDCRSDVERFCKDVAPGGGRILACLRGRQAELSPACAADLKRRGNRRPPAQ